MPIDQNDIPEPTSLEPSTLEAPERSVNSWQETPTVALPVQEPTGRSVVGHGEEPQDSVDQESGELTANDLVDDGLPGTEESESRREDGAQRPAPQSPENGPIDRLEKALTPLLADVMALRESLDVRVAEYEKTVRTLHGMVEDLQRQQLTGLLKPVFQEFADLQADLQSAEDQARERGDVTYAEEFEHFGQAIEKQMDHFDLESVGAVVGGPFVRRVHMAVLARPTQEPEQDQTIARVVRQGYRIIGETRALIPARVVVWKHEPAREEAGETDASS